MLMMVTCDEDGDISLRFYRDQEEFGRLAEFTDDNPPPRWLTAEEAAGDPNYWPGNGAFLAEVTPLRMEPEQVTVKWRVTAV
jgi:hypothetical protein